MKLSADEMDQLMTKWEGRRPQNDTDRLARRVVEQQVEIQELRAQLEYAEAVLNKFRAERDEARIEHAAEADGRRASVAAGIRDEYWHGESPIILHQAQPGEPAS